MAKNLIEAIAYSTHVLPDEEEINNLGIEKQREIAEKLGWEYYDVKPFEAISKARKALKSLLKGMQKWDDTLFETLKIEMHNHRKEGKMEYFDRIKIFNDSGFSYLIMYKYSGLGTYAVYRMSEKPNRPNTLLKSHLSTISSCLKIMDSDFHE